MDDIKAIKKIEIELEPFFPKLSQYQRVKLAIKIYQMRERDKYLSDIKGSLREFGEESEKKYGGGIINNNK